MSIILKCIFKFCCTNQMFVYLRQRYNSSQLSNVNNVIRLKGKLWTTVLSNSFLRTCICNRVVPVYITKRIHNSRLSWSWTVERMFMEDEINRTNRRLVVLRCALRHAWNIAHGFLSLFDLIRICRYIASIDERAEQGTYRKHSWAIDHLKQKRFWFLD